MLSANLAPKFGRGTLAIGVITGPTCHAWMRLGVGRHVIGRSSTADVRIEDPDVELHHGVLDVGVDAAVVFSQLTGRVPARIDGRTCRRGQRVGIGQTLQIGTSRIEIREWPAETVPAHIVPSDHDPWRQVVRRSPTADDVAECPEIGVPEQPAEHRGPSAIGLVGAGIAVAGAGLMAAVLGQMLLALFAAVGAVASLSTWVIGSLGALRQRRRATAEYRWRLGKFAALLGERHDLVEARHRVDHLGIVDVLTIIEHGGAGLWERRPQDEPLRVTIGCGTCRWNTGIAHDQRRTLQPDLLAALERCERLVDVPVPVDLQAGSVVVLRGDIGVATAIARSLVVQLAGLYGPADWRLVVVTDRPAEWDWVDWLPHAQSGGVVPSDEVARLADLDAPRIVPSDRRPSSSPTSPACSRHAPAHSADCSPRRTARASFSRRRRLRRRCASGYSTSERPVRHAGAMARRRSAGDDAADIRLAGISRPTAETAARRLAPLVTRSPATRRACCRQRSGSAISTRSRASGRCGDRRAPLAIARR